MMFTSGTQAIQGRTVNRDPAPYEKLYPYNVGRSSWPILVHDRLITEYAPRHEYDVLDSPILADLRENHDEGDPLYSFVAYLKLMELWSREFVFRTGHYATALGKHQIEHARRVLEKLVAVYA
jgi:hypothetical protein